MTPTPKKIAIYARVSTQDQSLGSQLHAIRQFLARSKWPAAGRELTFQEKISGKLSHRPELARMLQACRDGLVDTVVFYRLDRIGNSFEHLVKLMEELKALKIRVVGVADTVDTGTASAATEFFHRMLMTASAFGREITSERVRAGLKAAKAAGRVGGRPRVDGARLERAVALSAANPTWSYGRLAAHEEIGVSASTLCAYFKRKGIPPPRSHPNQHTKP